MKKYFFEDFAQQISGKNENAMKNEMAMKSFSKFCRSEYIFNCRSQGSAALVYN